MDKELLYKYFVGEATPDEEKIIMDWADASPENYRSYLKERKWWNALLVNSDLITSPQVVKPKKKINLWMFTTAAASIALLFTLFQWFQPADLPEEKWQSVWVPPGQRAQVTLEDGSTVWLNSRSTLTYPTAFTADKRIVKLNGEGFFEVQKNKKLPFIVETDKYNIEVLGTSFNVLAYKNHDIFETSLLSGSILISSSETNPQKVILKPNQKVYETAGQLQTTQIDNPDHFRWREGLICLDDERFEDLIKKFSLYFDIKITIDNSDFLNYRCTGKFRHSDGVDYALKVLQTEMKFNYTRNNELNEIRIR